MIIGKTNIDQDNYDCLVFCARDITNITIPNFIEHICSYSFDGCKQLDVFEFENDSKLQTIDKDIFALSSLTHFTISASVTDLQEGWCHSAYSLTKNEVDQKILAIQFLRGK